MALFNKADLSKPKYIVALVAKINAGDPIKVKGGQSYKFKKIEDLEKYQNDTKKYSNILYPDNTWASVFTDGKNSFRFIDIDKAPFSGVGGSRNSMGKALADAGELATVMSLTKKL